MWCISRGSPHLRKSSSSRSFHFQLLSGHRVDGRHTLNPILPSRMFEILINITRMFTAKFQYVYILRYFWTQIGPPNKKRKEKIVDELDDCSDSDISPGVESIDGVGDRGVPDSH